MQHLGPAEHRIGDFLLTQSHSDSLTSFTHLIPTHHERRSASTSTADAHSRGPAIDAPLNTRAPTAVGSRKRNVSATRTFDPNEWRAGTFKRPTADSDAHSRKLGAGPGQSCARWTKRATPLCYCALLIQRPLPVPSESCSECPIASAWAVVAPVVEDQLHMYSSSHNDASAAHGIGGMRRRVGVRLVRVLVVLVSRRPSVVVRYRYLSCLGSDGPPSKSASLLAKQPL